jgi:hypothetical protein
MRNQEAEGNRNITIGFLIFKKHIHLQRTTGGGVKNLKNKRKQ